MRFCARTELWALTLGVGPLIPEGIVAIDATGVQDPDSQVVPPGKVDKDGWWRTDINLGTEEARDKTQVRTRNGRGLLSRENGCAVGSIDNIIELPLADEELRSAGVSLWDAISSQALL